MCRNSIGTNAYTCDEIITVSQLVHLQATIPHVHFQSRSGKRVAVNNTDAEGRMAMADALSEFREKALAAKNAHVFTVATLTGHAILAYGHCAAAMDNGPARAGNYAEQLRNTADALGQPLEVSRLSHEDFDFHASDWEGAELKQATNKPSVQTMRGHQGPAAFLIRASRLDECGLDSAHPLKYTHLDIGFSMGAYPKSSLPSPLLALVAQ
jgi:leucyl aminopeptidase